VDGPLPATLTMLFSDIEGSTAHLARLGPLYAGMLEEHRNILRAAWRRWGGTELGTEGDSFFVTFEGALTALTAAVEAQRGMQARHWPEETDLRVRIGLHTGEPVDLPEGLVGMDVHRAARIAASGHGGQIVISDATRALVAGALPSGIRIVDLGPHRLKDLPEPERLYQVVADGLLTTFPPLRTLGTTTSLPRAWTPLVGRGPELLALDRLLRNSAARLITLVGPGGSGKTRLAIEIASRVADLYPDGVHFVHLADAADEAAMWSSIADALGVSDQRERKLSVLEHVRRTRALLVLDNVEQIAAAPSVAHEILEHSTSITILATARRPLHLLGEQEIHVAGLGMPERADLEELTRSEAVTLFCQHARLGRPTFELDTANATDVESICQRLDGLPLAIELVAARIKLLSPHALLSRLDALTRSTTHLVGRPERHQSLHSAIAWSYALLSTDQQRALRRLGVFAGGAELAAVDAVIANERDPLATVTDLVDASLAQISEAIDGEPRIRLLQTIADFARDRLDEAGELGDTRDRHAQYYLTYAEQQAPRLFTGGQLDARDRLEGERRNLTAALEWCLEPEVDADTSPERIRVGARLASQLLWFWVRTGTTLEGRRWLARATGLLPVEDSADLARALYALGSLLEDGTDAERDAARALLQRSLAICRELGDEQGVADALVILAWPYGSPYSSDQLREMLEESIAISSPLGDDAAPTLSKAIYRLGEVENARGSTEAAIPLFTRARDLARQRGDEFLSAGMQDVLTWAMIHGGDMDRARAELPALGREVLRLRDTALRMQVIETYHLFFLHAGDAVRTARLLGAHERLLRDAGATTEGETDGDYDRRLGALRATVPLERWAAELRAGAEASSANVLAEAIHSFE